MEDLALSRSPWVDDELGMLSDTCRQFCERECQPNYDAWEDQGHVDRALWLKAGEAGLPGAEVPEACGDPGKRASPMMP